MDLVCPDAAKLVALGILNASSSFFDNCYLRLFVNDITPSSSSILGDFTEASFEGYSEVAIEDWTSPTINESDQAESDGDPAAFSAVESDSGNLYGFYLVDSTNTTCLLAGRFDSAPIVVPAGSTLTITPSTLAASIY